MQQKFVTLYSEFDDSDKAVYLMKLIDKMT